MTEETKRVQLPVEVITDEAGTVISCDNETREKYCIDSIIAQGDTFEEAEQEFWKLFKYMQEYHQKRSRELDLWKPFQKGDWGRIGGSWLTIFGLHIYFRYGNGMKGGWYIPFTKVNVSFTNYWRIKS